jgi:hypothetical protein
MDWKASGVVLVTFFNITPLINWRAALVTEVQNKIFCTAYLVYISMLSLLFFKLVSSRIYTPRRRSPPPPPVGNVSEILVA